MLKKIKIKKKILIVTHSWPQRQGGIYGGIQNVAYMHAEELAKIKEYEINVFTSKENGLNSKIPKKVNLIEGNSLFLFYKKFRISYPLLTLNTIKKLKKAVKENDIIIINDRYYISSIFANKYAKEFNKKKILILHTPILKYSGCLNFLYKLSNFLGKKVVKDSDILISIMKRTSDEVLKNYNIKKNSEILYNPVNIKEFNKVKINKCKKFTVLFVGRFVKSKGVALLPSIAKGLLKEDIELIAVGDGPEFKKIINLSKGLNNIKFLGAITNRNKLIKLYKKSHLLLLTSESGETFPLVLIDGFAAGIPSVSTKVSPFSEIFKHDIGYFCEIGDKDNIVSSIIKLKNNNKDYKKKSKNALKFAKNELDIKIIAKKLNNIIEDLKVN